MLITAMVPIVPVMWQPMEQVLQEKNVGPAPDASLVGVKVLERSGSGSFSNIIQVFSGLSKIKINLILL